MACVALWCFFFFNDTATTEIYTLSLHDALPISADRGTAFKDEERFVGAFHAEVMGGIDAGQSPPREIDRKSTRLNSSHLVISYAVFCLKKKKLRLPSARRNELTP